MAFTVDEIDTIIEKVGTSGQSWTQDGTTYTAASLKSLMELRNQAQSRVTSASTRPLVRGFGFNSGYSGT